MAIRPTVPADRDGTSLTEVLAAILIMSVGVLSVMTLFPIAIVRSLQATQLTNATILAKRAEALVEMFDLTSDRFIPQPEEGRVTHAIIDPLGWNEYFTIFGTGNSIPWLYGNMGGTTPVSPGYLPPGLPFDPALTNEDLDAKWPVFKKRYRIGPGSGPGAFSNLDVRNVPGELTEPSGSLDGVPLRRLSFGPDGGPGFMGLPWGNNSIGPHNGQGPIGPYPSTGGSAFNSTLADPIALRDEILSFVGLPDHFEETFSGIPDAQTLTPGAQNVRFDSGSTDLSHLETHDGSVGVNPNPTYKLVPGSRAILIDATGTRSQVRVVPPISEGFGLFIYNTGTEWVIAWPNTRPLPFAAVSEVRIEIPQARYTWMLTVRKKGISGGSVSDIDCVAYFNRPLGDPEEELLHRAFAPVNNPNATPDPYQIQLGLDDTGPRDLLTIWFNASRTEDPPIKKGGWLFDPQNALWYRMVDVLHESETTNGGNGSATVQLDRRAESPISWVTVPEGIVHVYSLRSRVDQKRLDSARR